MSRSEPDLSELDPLPHDAPVPDAEALLRRIVATPPPAAGRPRRGHGRALALLPIALACALVALVAVVVSVRPDDDERAVDRPAAQPADTVLRYEIRITQPEEKGSDPFVMDLDVWQRGDGSHQRAVSRWSGTGSLQEVRTRSETLLYNEGSKRVIRYKPGDEDRMNYDSPPFLPPAPPAAHALPAAVGDPRTLPERARQADSGVSALDDGSIDGAPVRRFAVDGCRTRPPEGSAASRSVVSVSAGTGAPVRVEDQPCGAGGPGPATPQGPFAMKRTIDFRSFEVLPATPENLEQLELDVPPGTRTVDGVDIDLAEERDVG